MYLELRAYLGQKKPVAQNDLSIAILCAKMSRVIKALRFYKVKAKKGLNYLWVRNFLKFVSFQNEC